MSSPLTSGFCQQAFSDSPPTDSQPVVQVLSVKKINAAGSTGNDRYRWVLSLLTARDFLRRAHGVKSRMDADLSP